MRIHSIDQQRERACPAGRQGHRIKDQLLLLVLAVLSASATPVRPVQLCDDVMVAEVEWIVEAEDSVCGVSESRQIKKPAMVDFDRLMKLTPEWKKMEAKRIDRDSPEGVRLTNLAKSRVRDASSAIMKRQGYDSVWKKISSRRGTHVVNVTAYVEIELGNSPPVRVGDAL